jgi:hypothetical protein
MKERNKSLGTSDPYKEPSKPVVRIIGIKVRGIVLVDYRKQNAQRIHDEE